MKSFFKNSIRLYSYWKFKNNPYLFLIYQMGKVGSSSIYRTLKKNQIYAIHTHSHKEAKSIIKNFKGKIFVITGMREPLSRNISAFFQNINNKNNKYWYIGNKKITNKFEAKSFIKIFNERIEFHLKEVVNPWFRNFYYTCNIKKESLKKKDNLLTLNKNNLEIIVYKLEKFQDFEKYFFSRFCKIVPFKEFKKENSSSNKYYSNQYKDFISAYRINYDRYQNLYGNIDYLIDFYEKEEQIKYCHKFIEEL